MGECESQACTLRSGQLLRLIQDVYSGHEYNRTFLHAHLGLIGDVTKPYKDKICRWLWPDVLREEEPSVAEGKRAISEYSGDSGEENHSF